MLDRLIKNWNTTMAALIPAVVALGVWLGTDIDAKTLTVFTSAIYAIILLFSKDAPKE